MAQTYTLTVNIEKGGTQTWKPDGSPDTPSIAGHMWYSISDGMSEPRNYGFAPDIDHEGKPFAPGGTYNHDDTHYDGNPAYSKTITITQEQYDSLMAFGGDPSGYGFDMYYNVLTNSCIDFVWKALDVVGLNPTHYEGDLIPMWNRDNIDRLLSGQMVMQNPTWTDSSGITYQTSYSYTNGVMTKESWSGSDGSYGSYDYTNGVSSGNVRNADGTGYSYSNDGSDNVQVKNFDSTGKMIELDWSKADGSYGSNVLNADGSVTSTVTTIDGITNTTVSENNGFQTLLNGIATYTPTLIDALSLIKAIQSGEPLPIVTTGLRLANDISIISNNPNYVLSGAANVGSGILSIMSLDAALKSGDGWAIATSSAYTISFAASAYASFIGSTELTKSISETLLGSGVDHMGANALGLTDGALPYLNLVLVIQSGDEAGIAVAAVSLIPGMQWVGVAYGVYSMVDSLFGGHDIPDPWGTGRFVWDGTSIKIQNAGETGGNEAVSSIMQSVLTSMNSLIEQQRLTNPTSSLGIIANRMPSVAYDMSGYRYTDIDPLTGEERHPSLRFDTSGNPYNATAGSTESYRSIGEAIIMSALERSAIAPMWEVQTAKMQTDAGDPKAGLTEEARAGQDGQLASTVTGDTQTFRPVTLDLGGNGQIDIISKATSGISFDVDDSGYLKESAWVSSTDAFLTLDRDYNGETNSGREMFSNSTIAIGRRGLAGMGYVNNLIENRRVG